MPLTDRSNLMPYEVRCAWVAWKCWGTGTWRAAGCIMSQLTDDIAQQATSLLWVHDCCLSACWWHLTSRPCFLTLPACHLGLEWTLTWHQWSLDWRWSSALGESHAPSSSADLHNWMMFMLRLIAWLIKLPKISSWYKACVRRLEWSSQIQKLAEELPNYYLTVW